MQVVARPGVPDQSLDVSLHAWVIISRRVDWGVRGVTPSQNLEQVFGWISLGFGVALGIPIFVLARTAFPKGLTGVRRLWLTGLTLGISVALLFIGAHLLDASGV